MKTNNKALQKHEENTVKVSETSQIKKESWRVWLQAETHKSSPRLSTLWLRFGMKAANYQGEKGKFISASNM